jgi:glycosyltransferase involved in cell wall biosynthesis
MLSILILTLNEEINIEACIKSVSWCDDIVVLDSFSSDNTLKIARRFGARVFQRKFDDFGSHRNYAIDEIQFKYKWVFHLDADERFNDDLKIACVNKISENNRSAYFVPNKIYFYGKWVKYCTQYPYPQVRLIKLGEFYFEKSGHGQKEGYAKRGIGNIDIPYDHFNFSKGLEDWFEKHNKYSSIEARSYINNDIEHTSSDINIDSKDIVMKRKLKRIFNKIPFKPLSKFIYLYIFKLGFLDGIAGLRYCVLQSIYAYMIELKIKELRLQQKK